ncbi:MAG: hypothetical protein ACT4OX_01710 [Actinomycetota bacterium]
MKTTADEVLAVFSRSPRARAAFAGWQRDPHKREVVPVVMDHVSRVVYRLTLQDVRIALDAPDKDPAQHALGRIRKADVEHIDAVRDMHLPFAFTHVFHACLEKLGAVPTWQDFRSFCFSDSVGRRRLGEPAAYELERLSGGDTDRRAEIRRALIWRIGTAYYGVLRDIWVLAVLRDAGVDARTHPLADALFRVDCWANDTLISLYITNPRFKGASGGRKRRPEEILGDATPPFTFVSLQLPITHEFGTVHRPGVSEVIENARAAGLVP